MPGRGAGIGRWIRLPYDRSNHGQWAGRLRACGNDLSATDRLWAVGRATRPEARPTADHPPAQTRLCPHDFGVVLHETTVERGGYRTGFYWAHEHPDRLRSPQPVLK